MQIHAGMDQRMPLAQVGAYARRVEAIGFDGLNVPDAVHDGLLTATIALRETTRLQVATSVLVAFPRSPMNVAHAAWDLQAFSGGRFELGLGTQVRGNIVGRYSTPWEPPVPRMREYVHALRSIWNCWQEGGPLDFRGSSYRFTKMQPFFNPGPIEHPEIPILLGAVGPKMTRLVGEVADGMMSHPTNSAPRYLREVAIPEIEAGADAAGRERTRATLMAAGFVATGATVEQVARERESIRELLGFLYSTPAYWRSLELYGWGDIGRELHQLTRESRWADMAGRVHDEMLDTLVPQAPYDEIDSVLHRWYHGITDRITFPVPDDPDDDDRAAAVLARLHADQSA
ncbi:MAG: TIGR03617 family F420-dependent LLM class oxidoreductase [Deltaproteobacteria bacterium]|nr:TIGR03617 family F420-dependent LLM class oxidoreductase [Deltaproteobacteria bacterium]MBW2400541.1 TIGR03617 family F420-dependent LLM class oxidoreductase [Deltaproteobacteria bacterium]MBW2666441.1 TIGR03617 family F420-dependent LLM class oxidoreductase [Deltaproteobacteria bacterium]